MTSMADFPVSRLRRLRTTPALRDLVAETTVRTADLIAPLFVREGIDEPLPIASLPGVVQHTPGEPAQGGRRARRPRRQGRSCCSACRRTRTPLGSGAFDPDGIVQLALADLRGDVGDDVVLIADLCIDEYTDHGHCGVLDDRRPRRQRRHPRDLRQGGARPGPRRRRRRRPERDDGRAGRPASASALDDEGFTDVAILAYAAKYASALYGPFRDAVDVTIVGGGDRKGYQQDWRNGREALREIDADIAEGADMVMVKPALAYLDVIAAARRRVDVPLAAYHVSGEYAMIKAAAANGWIDHDAVALEHLTAIKRAGADIILTYFARWFAEGPGR